MITVNRKIEEMVFNPKPPQKLYLTGSRYFECNTDGSDWDYFTADTKKIRVWLEKEGFKCIGRSIYTDRHTVEVWRSSVPAIDVQIVKSVSDKLAAQEKIKKSGILKLLGPEKMYHKAIWNLVLP